MVDGRGTSYSYCTIIQKNLKQLNYNCEYRRILGKIQIVQTSAISANEKLSIQYTATGDTERTGLTTRGSCIRWLACDTDYLFQFPQTHPLCR